MSEWRPSEWQSLGRELASKVRDQLHPVAAVVRMRDEGEGTVRLPYAEWRSILTMLDNAGDAPPKSAPRWLQRICVVALCLLASSVWAEPAGPPGPVEPDRLAHFEPADRSGRGGAIALHVGLQAAAAGFDLWTTERCLRAGTCREANPLAGGRTPYGLKAGAFAVTAGLAAWAQAEGRSDLAWLITGLTVVAWVGFGVNNLRFGSVA